MSPREENYLWLRNTGMGKSRYDHDNSLGRTGRNETRSLPRLALTWKPC